MRKWLLIIISAFLVSVGIQLWLENTNRADSIGLWYTIASASIYAVVIIIVVKIIIVISSKLFHKKKKLEKSEPGL